MNGIKRKELDPHSAPTPTTKIGPTWAEVHTATQEEEMAKSQAQHGRHHECETHWRGGKLGCGGQPGHREPQFEDVVIEEEVVIESVMEEELEPLVTG